MAHILVIDDQDRSARLVRRVLPEHDIHGPCRSWGEAKRMLRRLGRRLDLVLLDVNFDIEAEDLLGLPANADEAALEGCRRTQGLLILRELRQGHPDLPVVLMTALDDLPLERAAEELSAQEYTYFLDDEGADASSLRAQIEGIVRSRRGQEREGPIYWGRGMEMRRIRSQLMTLARGRLPIILGGPTGTGKSLIARHFVHPRSQRKGRFVAVDLSTISRELMGAHLFGSTRGSYTGSVSDRKGAFEEADGGTLFLDEIGNLSDEAQKMLLTVLQEGAVTRVGDVRERKVDVKLVVATNEDLPEMVRAGRFRADLYMRLNPACTVELPSLKERQLDLPTLVEFCCERALAGPYLAELLAQYQAANGLGGSVLEVVAAARAPEPKDGVIHLLLPAKTASALNKHPWPGNLREFAMTVENTLVFTFAELVQLDRVERPDVVQLRPKLVQDLLRHTQGQLPQPKGEGLRIEVALRSQDTLNKVATEVERQYFTALFVAQAGDFGEMARVLMGDPDSARKVQLRFNQLGLKVRELRQRLG